jgi:hypothetical protein
MATVGTGREASIRSLADKLARYAETLSEDERALLDHLLVTALPPLERRRLAPETDRISAADFAFLDSLARKE